MIVLYYILIPIIAAIIINCIIYSLKLYKTSIKYLPAGYIIGIIWTVILGLLGYSNYLLYNLDKVINFGNVGIVLLILFCLAYPVITGLKEEAIPLLNLISLILAFTVSLIVIFYSKYIFLYLIPILIWLSYVNIIYVLQNKI